MKSAWVLALLGALASLQPALAETPAAVATRWGLLGSWRSDCSTVPTRDDVTLTFVVRDGRLFHDRHWGSGSDSSRVTQAAIRPDGTLDMTIVFASLSQTRQNVLTKTEDGHWRVLLSRNVDTDEYLFRDGNFVASGKPSLPVTRCAS